ncbi:MAG TPA: NAD(P)-dependent alcohol dehydrogenase [Coleofasciculaceae cyanobacterium]|jgi:NADPH:quinone reductase-like Zn-dependent oxidoreductase
MKAYQLQAYNSLEALQLIDLPEPTVGANDVLVKIRANSINYRELIILGGGYDRNKKLPVIPASDGVGQVVDIGKNATAFEIGDRVAGTFFQDWQSGSATEKQMNTALGGGIDGTLAEYVVFPEHALVKIPEHLAYEEAATLPCAALTAWNCLRRGGLIPGQTVLTLGTGGVSIFALQFAKLFGAKVIITSSSDEKLDRAMALGADATINYRTYPEWQDRVRLLTDGVGVDQVVEVGGAGTMKRSLDSARLGGYIGVIGVLSGFGAANFTPATAFFNQLRIQGIYVGNRQMFEEMNAAIALHHLQPVVDEIVPFSEAKRAYELLESGKHLGKIVISHA